MCDQMPLSNEPIQAYSRRQFIATALAGAGVLAAGPGALSAAQGKKKAARSQATDLVTLGATGIKTTRVAPGTPSATAGLAGVSPPGGLPYGRSSSRNWFPTWGRRPSSPPTPPRSRSPGWPRRPTGPNASSACIS